VVTQNWRLLRICLGLAVLLALSGVPTVLAEESVPGEVVVTGGPLTMSARSGPSVTSQLDGTDRRVTSSFTLDVSDATGSGAGWSLGISATPFTTGGPAGHALPADAMTITGVVAACASGTCTDPVNAVAYPLTVPTGTEVQPVPFFTAAPGTGMGAFTVSPTVEIAIPANAYAGSYTTTITLSIVSGP